MFPGSTFNCCVCVFVPVIVCGGVEEGLAKDQTFLKILISDPFLFLFPDQHSTLFSNFFDTVSGQSVFSDIKWQGAMSAAG